MNKPGWERHFKDKEDGSDGADPQVIREMIVDEFLMRIIPMTIVWIWSVFLIIILIWAEYF